MCITNGVLNGEEVGAQLLLYLLLLFAFVLQSLMLMEILLSADGLSQLKGSAVVCARLSQLNLIRFVVLYGYDKYTF